MERKKEERNTTESVMLLEQNSSADMVKIMEDWETFQDEIETAEMKFNLK